MNQDSTQPVEKVQQAYAQKNQAVQDALNEKLRLEEELHKFQAVIDAINKSEEADTKNTDKLDKCITEGSNMVTKQVKSGSDRVVATIENTSQSTRDALDKLIQVTLDSKDEELLSVVSNFTSLIGGLNDAISKIENGPLHELPKVNQELSLVLEAINKELTEKEEPDYTECFKELENAVKAIDVKPVVKVTKENFDLTPITDMLTEVKDAIIASEIEVPENDLSPIVSGLQSVQDTIANLKFPSPNYILPFKAIDGSAAQAELNSDGSLAVSQAVLTERYDIEGTTIYTATAPVGTSNCSIGWTIIKYDLSDMTNASGKVATNVSWNNRTSGTYA